MSSSFATVQRFMSSTVIRMSAALLGAAGIVWLLNKPLFSLLNGSWGAVPDSVMLSVTHLGNGVVAALIFCLLAPFRKDITVRAILAIILAGIITSIVKELVSSPRPPSVLGEGAFVLGPVLRGNSFPSGHTATAFAAAFSLRPLAPWWVYRLAVGAAAAVGFSRIYIGAHFPLDAFFGAAAGWIAAWAVLHGFEGISARLERTGRVGDRVYLALAAASGVWLLLFEPMTAYNPYVLRSAGAAGIILALIMLAMNLKSAKR